MEEASNSSMETEEVPNSKRMWPKLKNSERRRNKNKNFAVKVNKLLKFKDAEMAINEMGFDVVYTGSHLRDGTYKCDALVNGITYTAFSDNAKNAKTVAAKKALDTIIVGRITSIREGKTTEEMGNSVPFKWNIALPYMFTRCAEFVKNEPPPPTRVDNEELEEMEEEEQESPIQTVRQKFPGIVLVECVEGPPNNIKLSCIAEFDNRTFHCTARNLKLAKRMVCQEILDHLRTLDLEI